MKKIDDERKKEQADNMGEEGLSLILCVIMKKSIEIEFHRVYSSFIISFAFPLFSHNTYLPLPNSPSAFSWKGLILYIHANTFGWLGHDSGKTTIIL